MKESFTIELKPWDSSTMRTVSVCYSLNILLAVWTVASLLAPCPVQSCNDPVAFKTSILRSFIAIFPMLSLKTSPIPIGLTPDCLTKGINLHARKASRCFAILSGHNILVISAIVFLKCSPIC